MCSTPRSSGHVIKKHRFSTMLSTSTLSNSTLSNMPSNSQLMTNASDRYERRQLEKIKREEKLKDKQELDMIEEALNEFEF